MPTTTERGPVLTRPPRPCTSWTRPGNSHPRWTKSRGLDNGKCTGIENQRYETAESNNKYVERILLALNYMPSEYDGLGTWIHDQARLSDGDIHRWMDTPHWSQETIDFDLG